MELRCHGEEVHVEVTDGVCSWEKCRVLIYSLCHESQRLAPELRPPEALLGFLFTGAPGAGSGWRQRFSCWNSQGAGQGELQDTKTLGQQAWQRQSLQITVPGFPSSTFPRNTDQPLVQLLPEFGPVVLEPHLYFVLEFVSYVIPSLQVECPVPSKCFSDTPSWPLLAASQAVLGCPLLGPGLLRFLHPSLLLSSLLGFLHTTFT